MTMRNAHAELLADDDDAMQQHSLEQPPGALEAWMEHLVTVGGSFVYSELMLLYTTTRTCYDVSEELTVDYGPSYGRDYYAGKRTGSKARRGCQGSAAPT